jgi:cytochrome c oxidase cbb3-type subunit 3
MRRIPLTLIILALAACGPSEEELAQRAAEAAAAAQDSAIAQAETMFDAAVFDTLTWESDQARLDRGAQVYNFSCTKCHGDDGAGDAGFVMNGDTLRPPSFADPEWAMAGDVEAIRQAIFVGTKEGMPHWGLEGLKAESVDAVTAHILSTMVGGDEG